MAQGGSARLMHGGPHRHLDRFQVELSGFALVLKDDPEQVVYFALDFLLDHFGRFFFCTDTASAIGRTAQSCSLTNTTCSQRS